MSDEKLRTSNNRALWLGLAITLGPLAVMPFAARSPAYEQYRQPPARVGMQSAPQPAPISQAPAAERSS